MTAVPTTSSTLTSAPCASTTSTNSTSTIVSSASTMSTLMRTAVDLKTAIDSAPERLQSLGNCATALVDFEKETREKGRWVTGHWEAIPIEAEADDEEGRRWKKARLEEEVSRFDHLLKLYQTTHLIHGEIPTQQLKEMRLTVAKGGKRYDGSLDALSKTKDHLEHRFQAGDPSPYGDVRTQTTVVDKSVRDAVEIQATNFTVSPELCCGPQGETCHRGMHSARSEQHVPEAPFPSVMVRGGWARSAGLQGGVRQRLHVPR